jgi:hypothetical protein
MARYRKRRKRGFLLAANSLENRGYLDPDRHGESAPTSATRSICPSRGDDIFALIDKNFLGALVVVVASEGLVRVDDRESRSASGDCQRDSNKYEDFSHDRILSKNYPGL